MTEFNANEKDSEVPIPFGFSDVVYKGKFHNVLIEQNYDTILKTCNFGDLSNIISDQFIKNFDLTLQKFEGNLFKDKKIINVMEINNTLELLENQRNMDNYISVLTDESGNPIFIKSDNFAFSKTESRMATVDFRVFIHDLTGKVPKDVSMHVGSLCVMMLSGKIEYPIGYDSILRVLKKYGVPIINFKSDGYIHLTIDNPKSLQNLIIKGGIRTIQKSN